MENIVLGSCLGECIANLPPEAEFPNQEFIERKMQELDMNEVNYYIWIPGYKYQPSLKERIESARSSSTADSADLVNQPEVQESELAKKFNSKASGGKVYFNDVPNLLRSLGYAPTQAELKESAALFGDSLTFSQFQDLCNALAVTEVNVHQLEKSLRYFDTTGSGKLSKSQWNNILLNYGEPLTKKELELVNSKLKIGDFIDCRAVCEEYIYNSHRVTSNAL